MFSSGINLFLLAACVSVWSQSQTLALSFEAATVKRNTSGEIRMVVDFQPGGRFSAVNVPLRVLTALAYHTRPNAVTGGPSWLTSDRFDIVAKASQTATPEEMSRMLQTLLAERFKLEIHSDRKNMPAYALLPGKTAKYGVSDTALLTNQRCRDAEAIPGQKHVVCEHMTMALFADTLQEIASRDIDVPVVDQTGIQGTYTFNLSWTPSARGATADPLDLTKGPTLFDALEDQLGLKLERRGLPLPVIVVDHVEQLMPPR